MGGKPGPVGRSGAWVGGEGRRTLLCKADPPNVRDHADRAMDPLGTSMCALVGLLAPLSPAHYVNARSLGFLVYCQADFSTASAASLRACQDFKNSPLDIRRDHVRRCAAVTAKQSEIRCAVYR